MNDFEKRLLRLEESLARHIRDNEDSLANIDEESLTFRPVKSTGGSVCLSVSDGKLYITAGEEKYHIELIKEEEKNV